MDRRIRYYGRLFDPKEFDQGVRGRAIRLLNWLRWKLECWVTYHVMLYLVKRKVLPSLTAKERVGVLDAFKAQWKVDQETGPNRSNLRVLGVPDVTLTRAERYVESRKATVDQPAGGTNNQQFARSIARASGLQPYVSARESYTVQEVVDEGNKE